MLTYFQPIESPTPWPTLVYCNTRLNCTKVTRLRWQSLETTVHVAKNCAVANDFRRLVSRVFFGATAVAFASRRRHPRSILERLVVVAGEYVLWRSRGVVVAERRRVRMF